MLAAERVDNVLAQMVPDTATTLVGMRMEQLKATPLFQKMVSQQQLSQLDEFARESGFDPRRDVRDLLIAVTGKDQVLLARGNFHVTVPASWTKVNYHGYVVILNGGPQSHGGFAILDSTLAVAGPLDGVHLALDQYKSGKRNNASALLTRARAIPDNFQFWAVTTGGGNLFAGNMPGASGGLDFGRLLRSLQNTVFEADLRNGLKGMLEGECTSAQDAKSLADAARGMVGMGRLNTPENQPDLLRLWDGIKVVQNDQKVTVTADIGQDLIDQLSKVMPSTGPNRKRPGGVGSSKQ